MRALAALALAPLLLSGCISVVPPGAAGEGEGGRGGGAETTLLVVAKDLSRSQRGGAEGAPWCSPGDVAREPTRLLLHQWSGNNSAVTVFRDYEPDDGTFQHNEHMLLRAARGEWVDVPAVGATVRLRTVGDRVEIEGHGTIQPGGSVEVAGVRFENLGPVPVERHVAQPCG